MTAAHKTLPFGTKVRVTNQRNGQSVVVTINDRGPYVGGRVIDLSSAAAGAINMKGAGVAPVSLAVLGRINDLTGGLPTGKAARWYAVVIVWLHLQNG